MIFKPVESGESLGGVENGVLVERSEVEVA